MTLSSSVTNPAIDRVDSDYFAGSRMAVQALAARGYRRPGFFLLSSTDSRTHGRWRGGFLAARDDWRGLQRVPPLVVAENRLAEVFRKWFVRWRPDVLVSIGLGFGRCLPVLRELGVAVPGDVGVVELNLHTRDGSNTGVYTGVEERARITVDHLVSNLYRNKLGLPETPRTMLVGPTWYEGVTLPVRRQ